MIFPMMFELIKSRSGASATVYQNGEFLFRMNGSGFNRRMEALGQIAGRFFGERLANYRDYNMFPVHALDCIGLSVTFHDSRSGTIIIITKKGGE